MDRPRSRADARAGKSGRPGEPPSLFRPDFLYKSHSITRWRPEHASPLPRPDRLGGRGPGARPGPGRCPAGRRRLLRQPRQPHLFRAPDHQHGARPSPADGPHHDRAEPRRRDGAAGPASSHRPAQPGRRLLLALALHGGPDGRADRRRPRRPALRPRPVRRLHRHRLLPRPAAPDRPDRRPGLAGGGLPAPSHGGIAAAGGRRRAEQPRPASTGRRLCPPRRRCGRRHRAERAPSPWRRPTSRPSSAS